VLTRGRLTVVTTAGVTLLLPILIAASGLPVASAATSTPAPRTTPTAAPVERSPAIGGGRLGELGTAIGTGPGVGALPTVTAAAFLVANATTGKVLVARAAHLKRPPASTLKTLTALTLIPRLDPQGEYKVVAADTTVEGSRVGLVAGSTYTHQQLFTALFLPSANDAATALARSRGSVKQTVRDMNDEARRIQAFDTVAKNPSGLDADGQVSSVYDLALIARQGLLLPDFATYASTVRTKFPGKQPKRASQKRATFTIETQNRLMRDGYPGMIGVKTGYTTKARRTYVGAAERGGTRLIVTMMANVEPTEVDARRLLDWGFANQAKIDAPVGELVEPTGPATIENVDSQPTKDTEPISKDVSTAASVGESESMLRWGVLIAAIAAAIGMLALVYVGNGSLTRRRVRKRYHR